MRVHIIGEVVERSARDWTKQDGSVQAVAELYVKGLGSSARFGADKVEAPLDCPFQIGEVVDLVCNVSAKDGRRGAWLSVYCSGGRVLTDSEAKAFMPKDDPKPLAAVASK